MSQQVRYEVITQEDPETGDLIVPIPPELLKSLGWKEGDQIEFAIGDNGSYVLQRASE
jgi:antitoxin component of MazEF toxin-antitoxin module